MQAETTMKRARAALILDHPFFGALALRLELIADPGIPTAATNGKVLRYNPAFIADLRPDQVRGLIAHEVMHCAHGHQWRRSGRDLGQWNIAADYAINSLIVDAGLTLPDTALIDPAYADKSAESVYRALRDSQTSDGHPDGGGADSGASPDSGGQDDGQAQDNGAPCDSGQPGPDGQDGGAPDPGGCGAVIDGDVTDDDTMSAADWEVATVQAARAATMGAGELPGAIKRLVDRLTDRSLDWRVILADFVQRSARNDYSWQRPAARYAHRGVVLPTLHSDELPALVVAVDTSGSVDNRALARFAAALSDAAGAYQTTVHVVCCDSRVQATAEYTTADLPITIEPIGGGGTDFRPVFDWVAEQGLEPSALIYFTDLDYLGHRWPDEPDYPVLWVTPGEPVRPARWGETIRMGE